MIAKSIMIVEQSVVERRLIKGLLRDSIGCQIAECEDGIQALDRIEMLPPDLVLAGLRSPETGDLALTQRLRVRFPQLPLVLVTAPGSEASAVQALAAGAASYIPRARQAERLPETVSRVLRHVDAERRRQELELHELYCSYSLANSIPQIAALTDQMHGVMASVGLGDPIDRIRACVALEEALMNAMYHGNLELSESQLDGARSVPGSGALADLIARRTSQPRLRARRIDFQGHLCAESARFVIRDEGRGFEHRSLQDTLEECFERGCGRGLMLMRLMMDEVKFNDAGNEVSLVKRVG